SELVASFANRSNLGGFLMDYIWKQDALWVLLKHRSEDVQAWAALRLLELYPETANELLRLLSQFEPYVASVILSYDAYRDCPPELMTFFQQTREPHLKAGDRKSTRLNSSHDQ